MGHAWAWACRGVAIGIGMSMGMGTVPWVREKRRKEGRLSPWTVVAVMQ